LSDRIRLIDALRGLALAGIAMVHFGEQYLGYMPPAGAPYNVHGAADGVLEALAWIFIRGKGFGLFSLMFGLSFALQMQRAARRDPGRDFRPRFAWRLLILFVIGGLHGLLYSGDILTVYALLGLPLMMFYRVGDRWLLVLALVLLVGTPRVVGRIAQGPASDAQLQSLKAEMEESATRHWHALATGDVPAILRFHAGPGFQAKWAFQFGAMGRGYQTFALFLVGLWAGRRRLFEDVEPNRRLFERIARWTGGLTLGIPVLALGLFLVGRAVGGGAPAGSGSSGQAGLPDFSSWPVIAGLCVFDAWNAVMTAFCVAVFVLLFQRERWRRRLVRFAPVGRMALSSYLAQTVIGSLVFFGFGLGLLGRFGNTVTLPMGAVVFALQVWLCHAWLARYRFGPVEWLWRSLTWLRWEPIRQPAAAGALSA
jgi:uncharacterized protein